MRAASLVVVLQDGISLPPLLFHAGGMPELIRCLQQVWSPAGEKGGGDLQHEPGVPPFAYSTNQGNVCIFLASQHTLLPCSPPSCPDPSLLRHQHMPRGLARCSGDPSVYLVNDMADPLPRTLLLSDPSTHNGKDDILSANSATVRTYDIPGRLSGPPEMSPSPQPPEVSGPTRYHFAPLAGDGADASASAAASSDALEGRRGADEVDIPEEPSDEDWQGPLLARWQAQGWSGWLAGVQRKLAQAAAAAAASVAAADNMPWRGGSLLQDEALMYCTAMAMDVPGAMGAMLAAEEARSPHRSSSLETEAAEAGAGGDGGSGPAAAAVTALASKGNGLSETHPHAREESPMNQQQENARGSEAGLPRSISAAAAADDAILSASRPADLARASSSAAATSDGNAVDTTEDGFELVDLVAAGLMHTGLPWGIPAASSRPRGPPLSAEEWQGMLDPGEGGQRGGGGRRRDEQGLDPGTIEYCLARGRFLL